jgi:hypothetical protein
MEVVLLFLAGTAVAIKLATLFRHQPDVEIRRGLAAMPATPVTGLQPRGTFKVVGRIRLLRAPVSAPASGRECVGFRLQVDELVMGVFWKPVVRLNEVPRFAVEDETGQVEIDPQGHAAVVLMEDAAGPAAHGFLAADSGVDRVGPLKAFLHRRGLPCPSHSLRFSEGILHEGQLVAVAGEVRTELDPHGQAPGPRRLPEKLVLTGSPESPLLVSDTRECV